MKGSLLEVPITREIRLGTTRKSRNGSELTDGTLLAHLFILGAQKMFFSPKRMQKLFIILFIICLQLICIVCLWFSCAQ